MGGSATSTTEFPAWITDPSQRAIQRGEDIARIGYTPYYGPDVAAFTPQQMGAFGMGNQAASAFGFDAPEMNIPQPQQFAGGVQGYSSQPLFQESLDAFTAARPGQAAYIDSFFIDPVTGQPTGVGAQAQGPGRGGTSMEDRMRARQLERREERRARRRARAAGGGGSGGGLLGGYSGFSDLFDGGGPGASGDTFQGGGFISDFANKFATPIQGGGFKGKG